jgi:EAL domain-containing protein (putative c-di-GMP-specific phosphodiesterase class I)/PAS domain-containing protein
MTPSAAQQNSEQRDEANAGVSVLLLDTPENLGIDFLQMLQRQELKLAFERVNDKEGLHAALRNGNWDILLVCDQVNVPGQDETLAFLKQLNCETGYVLLSKAELSIEALTRAYRKGMGAVVSAHNPEYSLEVFTREAERCRRNLQLSLLHQEKFDLKRACMQLMSGTQEALAYLHDGIHVFGNEAYLKLLGYDNVDDLLVLPFIDLVSTEMREKTKQRLLDFQHRARMQPDTKELEIPELFVNAIGEREGILQVAATFKPVVYEGENCVQVVFKFSTGEDTREESGVAEGLGYPLFITHLDNLIAHARAAGRPLGQVLHIRASGCEHYIAGKGFGSLNGKLKALASELKAALGSDDLLIRFTETSFLALHKAGAGSAQLHETLATLLGKFEKALNREIGSAQAAGLITFAFDAVPVDAQSPPAEQVVRGFLQPTQLQAPQAVKPAVEPVRAEAPAVVKAAEPVKPPPLLTEVVKSAPEKPALDLPRLNTAFAANQLKLLYETVISVSDIETEFHDICVGLPQGEGSEILSRAALGTSELAGKLDLWTLHNALAVIADLYNQGQEYPVLISLSARSLTNKRLVETIRNELKSYGLPAEMLVLDFALADINSDVAAAAVQLEKLKADGISLCISEVHDISELKEILKLVRVERIRLQRAFVEAAAQGERAFSVLKQSVEKLHALKMKVFAGDVASNSELSLCCKAGIDLVKGKCIQKGPQALDADSMAEALMT